jgi:hypothetical protein
MSFSNIKTHDKVAWLVPHLPIEPQAANTVYIGFTWSGVAFECGLVFFMSHEGMLPAVLKRPST